MHEASIMKDLMDKVVSVAAKEGVARVTSVTVWLGALSHMSPEHFGEHFKESSKGSLAEGALVVVEQSDDIHHPDAQTVMLRSIEAED